MSLISLLIALAAERYLSSSAWQFTMYFSRYSNLFGNFITLGEPRNSLVANSIFIIIPVSLCYLLLNLVDNSLLHFLFSTIILIVCFGCFKTRDTYKQYLMAAFRGESTTCEMHHKQLLQDKNLPDMGFGQSLIWLNYRYFIAIMIFFVVFGAPGALFYRLVCKLNEDTSNSQDIVENNEQALKEDNIDGQQTLNEEPEDNTEHSEVNDFNQHILFWLDWLPVRIVAFGYMLVGHFSRALPVWLENLFDVGKLPHKVLISVAEKSEDFMVDQDDCTAEPCLLVRLAKRSLLLCLSVIAILILTGVIS
ncbi:MAG: beta-lactamase regulator AmpE [Colwelliaceae bacterium]|nr:beta-lactamase regulator AmpE [Colwelliaceae bacterium]